MTNVKAVDQINTEKIYSAGRKFTFNCSFYDKHEKLIESEKNHLHILGEKKEGTTDQFKAHWEYESIPDQDKNVSIGITENSKRIFLHQPRLGKYLFTELCNFPSIYLPAYVGLKTKGKITIPFESEIYGAYQGWKVKTKSKIVSKEKINIEIIQELPVWKIESTSKHKKGKSFGTFYFNENYGFVKLIFKHFDKSFLIMELTEIH